MSERPSDAHFERLEARLRDLAPLVEAALPPDACRWYVEYLDAAEYGLAVQTAAEALGSDPSEAGRSLRARLHAEARGMGIVLPGSG